MLKIDLSFGSPFGYRNAFVVLEEGSHEITVALENGTNTFKSSNVIVGALPSFGNRQLMAYITFRYSYDEARGVVTVCGTDFASSDAMCLVTFPEGTSEYCYQRATSSGGFLADDLMANPHWNYRTPLMPGLEDVLRGMARAAGDSLIAALEKLPDVIVQVRKNPPELPVDVYRRLLAVYRGGVFHELYEQGRELGPDDVVRTIESTYGGKVTFNKGEAIANVIGSTNDPNIYGQSWLTLWARDFADPTICTSYGMPGFSCGSYLVGGHVVRGMVARQEPRGSNSVYIMPICIQHNNNNNVYMQALQYTGAVWLNNYLQ